MTDRTDDARPEQAAEAPDAYTGWQDPGSWTADADTTRQADRGDLPAVVEERADLWIDQSDNKFNTNGEFDNTCGLASTTEVLRDFGHDVTLDDVAEHALDNGQCEEKGVSTEEHNVSTLNDFGEPAKTLQPDTEGLADLVDAGHGVIATVSSADLRGATDASTQDRHADHAVFITGVERDPVSGEPRGFFYNDTGVPDREAGAAQYARVEKMEQARTPGFDNAVVTDATRPMPDEH